MRTIETMIDMTPRTPRSIEYAAEFIENGGPCV